jgi:biopolymer transport protein ExbD
MGPRLALFDPRLVLVLTFLVLAPSLSLWRSEPHRSARSPQPEQLLTVWVRPDAIYIEETLVAEADLSRVLGEVRDSYPEAAVVVRGDRRLPYERVRHVLHLVNRAGFRRASLAPAGRAPAAG